MVFSKITFLFYFLPISLLLYFLAPKKLRNAVLLLVSLTFYAWGEPRIVFIMMLTILQGYIFGILTDICKGAWKKTCLIASLVLSLGSLGYFKYTDFFLDAINSAFHTSIPLLKIALPIGISFYTFQIISYNVDVYRGKVPPQRNILNLALYVSFFPQLIAGPIVIYEDFAPQLTERRCDIAGISAGIRRFVIGLGKKVLIGDTLSALCVTFRSSPDKSVLFFWLYAVAYTLHIYFDFSGYSDMAVGLGRIFGFTIPENFRYPYISGSVTEFWRRWHITLGQWFRDYVYIPLGGSRVGKVRLLFNLLAVWAFTGLWHGAAWNFVLWGLFYFVLLLLEKYWLLKYLKKSRVLNHIYVLLAVILGFVLFDASGVKDAFNTIGAMFGVGGYPLVSATAVYYLRSYGFVLAAGMIGATPLLPIMAQKLGLSVSGKRILNILEPIFLALVFLSVTGYLVDGSFSPFLYFRF